MAKMSYKGELKLLSHRQAMSLAIALGGVAAELAVTRDPNVGYLSTFPLNTEVFTDYYDLFFGGSLCRKVPTSADIDLAVLVKDREATDAFFQVLIDHYSVVPPLINGEKLKRFILHIPWVNDDLPFQLDVWLTDEPKGWSCMKMFVAGDGRLNASQRGAANRKGLMLNQYGIYRSGVIIPVQSEQEVYKLIGWRWLEYPERTLDRTKLSRTA